MEKIKAQPANLPPTPYGRACMTCARAKARCIISQTAGAKCERCSRLRKECEPPVGVRKRRTVKNTYSTKTARLEEKLDGLVSLLQSTTKPNSVATNSVSMTSSLLQTQAPSEAFHIVDTISITPRNSGLSGTENNTVLVPGYSLKDNIPPTWSVVTPPASQAASPQTSPPCSEEAEEFFQNFRANMLPNLPFIRFSSTMTAEQLHKESPFLWLCVMAVASNSSSQRKALEREIRLRIGQEVWLESQTNLDILLGLLTFLNWAHHHFTGRPIIIQVIALCNSMLECLGLHKPPPKESPRLVFEFNARGCPIYLNVGPRTLNERRTALGCFLISSDIASYFQKSEPPQWTLYLEECLKVISKTKETESDLLLVQLVRLQLIRQKVFQAPWHCGQSEETASIKPAAAFYFRALHSEVQDFKNKIPVELQQNEALLLTLYNTELNVHEIVLSQAIVGSIGPDFQRLESFHSYFTALKSWFELFFTIPPARHIGFTQQTFSQLAHCTVALYRLTFLEDHEWDKVSLRQNLNIVTVLDQLVDKFAVVKLAAKLDCDSTENNDVYSGLSRRFTFMRNLIAAKMTAETENVHLMAGHMDAVMGDAGGSLTSPFQDDFWLNDLMCFGESFFEPYFQ